MIGGYSPFPFPERTERLMNALEFGAENFIAMFGVQGPIPDEIKRRVRAADTAAVAAMLHHRLDHDDGVADALHTLNCP